MIDSKDYSAFGLETNPHSLLINGINMIVLDVYLCCFYALFILHCFPLTYLTHMHTQYHIIAICFDECMPSYRNDYGTAERQAITFVTDVVKQRKD